MSRMLQRVRMMGMMVAGGFLFTSSCLPDNFWASFLGDTLVAGSTSTVRDLVISAVLTKIPFFQ